jgi:hypothetical protein
MSYLLKHSNCRILSSSLLIIHDRNNRKRKFRSHRPKWVDPNVYLDPGFQNLFELSYFTSAKELVPVGWGSVDEDKDYPKLSSRDPQVLHSMQEDGHAQDDYAMLNGRTQSEGTSDAEEDDAPQLVAPTRMTEESSDEDEPAAPAPNISRVRSFSSLSPTALSLHLIRCDEVYFCITKGWQEQCLTEYRHYLSDL